MTKRVLSVVLSLVVLLVALPVVPLNFGISAKAEDSTTAVVYDNGPDFKILSSKDANSFPSASGGYAHAGASPGAGANYKYYNYCTTSSITAEYDAEREAAKQADLARARQIIENSRIKQLSERQKLKETEELKATENVTEVISTVFTTGDKVFHEKFGTGIIENIKAIGDSTMYMINFGAQGTKAMDSTFARLQKIE